MFRPTVWLALLIAVLSSAQAGAGDLASSAELHASISPDRLLAATLEDIRAVKPASALASVNRLIALQPDFRLAYLIKGDLLLAKTRELQSFGGGHTGPKNSLDDLKDEARVRLLGYLDPPKPDQLPAQILQLAPEQKYALLADASRARLYVFENVHGEPHLIHDYYLSVGKNGVGKHNAGDKRSPSGVYSITAALPKKRLTPFYGPGAYQIGYPNAWDRLLGHSGYGIWLHGVPPYTYSRPPKTSDGCLVLANADWHAVAHYIRPEDTPLVITRHSEWLNREAWLKKRKRLMAELDTWTGDWQKLKADRYLALYAPGYLSRLGKSWAASKKRNIDNKRWIKVRLTDLSLFLYNSKGRELAVADFTQHYDSNSFKDVTRKSLYIEQKSGDWRIVMEKVRRSAPAIALKN